MTKIFVGNFRGPQGRPGDPGVPGPPGRDGAGVSILGTLANESELPDVGSVGDAYLIDGDLFVWSASSGDFENVGTIAGPQGDPGAPGPSAFDLAVANGYEGTLEEWLEQSRGPQGLPGDPGARGPAGPVGPPGTPGPPGEAIQGAPGVWPQMFPPTQHSHGASEISDATSVGRNILRAQSQQAAREAIGAGTGNGSSNLRIGPSSTEAAAGNHSHSASNIGITAPPGMSATDVQGAIVELSLRPSGGGSSGALLIVRYSAGSYPAQPTSPPVGITVRHFYGPTQYRGAVWPGVIDRFTRVDGLT